ncbi:MAG TPA: SUMF1/EgtB/PvdO family nonheme iron enzyme, partial [Candidatus Wallbacteria bacterium]|nr:SUMF1/EgtB/PvdO family nonheme iron enzyme [Candidatus Wallbacteria bacterium]
MKKSTGLFLLSLVMAFFLCQPPALAQTQVVDLKAGFNFVSFTINPSAGLTPAGFIQSSAGACEDIFLYSPSSGSFLSAGSGAFTAFSAGNGYIFKMKTNFPGNFSGTAVSKVGAIKINAGFNLVGFSKAAGNMTFSYLMKRYPFITGIYKWAGSSGSFVQVVKNGSAVETLDGIDPTVTAGHSYFMNFGGDTTLDLDGLAISFGGVTAAVSSGSAKSIDLGGGVKLDMVYIPAGSFMMGEPGAATGGPFPQHAVRITRGFYMAKFETTQAQWQAVMGNNPSFHKGDSGFPVEMVSWDDICNPGGFLDKLNGKGQGVFRLPTEAEWEYACRAGSTTTFYWGNTFDGGYCWYSGMFISDGNSGQVTHPVGQRRPNLFGLYDMSRNVQEWCADWYANYPSTSGNSDDPAGPSAGTMTSSVGTNMDPVRVIRGGSAITNPADCSSTYRDSLLAPRHNFRDIGFRIVMSPDTATYYLNKNMDSTIVGGTYNLTGLSMLATFPNGISQTLTPAWTLISGGGSISGGTNYIAPAVPGVAILQASYVEAGITKTANFKMNITPDIASVTISGGTVVAAGKTLQLAATAKNTAGSVVTGRTPVWTSLNPSVATVNSTGLVSGVASGSAVIRVTIDGKAQDITISVMSPSALPVKVIGLGGGVNLEMVYIPAGTFVMGTPENEPNRGSTGYEGPQHTVNITRGFYMGKYEVTQAQWKAIMGSREFSPGGDDFPAATISWTGIADSGGFLDTLNQKSLGTFSLPTEAQWEYACRAGTKTPYYWGDTMNEDYCWYQKNFYGDYSVGKKLPNAWGLYDMIGGVWEWCYDGLATYNSAIVNDPSGPGQTVTPLPYSSHVIRGGCYNSDVYPCRCGARNFYVDGPAGFRLVMAEVDTEKVLIAMKLSNGTDSVFVNQIYDLSKISANLQYTGEKLGTSHLAAPQWSIKSGAGNVSGTIFTAPAIAGTTILTASFTEGGKTVKADFIIIAETPSVTATIGAAGGTISGSGIKITIPPNVLAMNSPINISSTSDTSGFLSENTVGNVYRISGLSNISGSTISVEIELADTSKVLNGCSVYVRNPALDKGRFFNAKLVQNKMTVYIDDIKSLFNASFRSTAPKH